MAELKLGDPSVTPSPPGQVPALAVRAAGYVRTMLASTPLRKAVGIALPILVWEIGARLADNRLLPAPATVLQTMWAGLENGLFLRNAQTTFARGAVGFVCALAIGIGFGAAMARNRWIEALFQPVLAASYAVPKLALYPLVILALGFGAASKVVMVALECAYPLMYNTYAGIQAVDRRYLWVARNVGASRPQMLGVLLRAAVPAIMAGVRMAVPIALTIMIVTELIGESVGLGFLIRQAGTNFRPDIALAVISLLAIVGFILDRVVVALGRILAPWAKGVEL